MAQQSPTSTGASLNPSRYTEQRAAQFAGGDTDPETGNLIPATRSSYTDAPLPAAPKTQLGSVEPLPTLLNTPTSSNPYQAPKGPRTTEQLGAIAGAALPLIGKAVSTPGSTPSSFDGSGRMPNAGGFSTGGGTGNGGNGGQPYSAFSPDPAPSSPSLSGGALNPMTADIPSAPSGGGTWAKDYSGAPFGTYTDTGYVTKAGFTPYASEKQKSYFAGGGASDYSAYNAPDVFTPSYASGAEYSSPSYGGGESYRGSEAPSYQAPKSNYAEAPSYYDFSGFDLGDYS